MKLSKKSPSFEPCPEYTGVAVCVDITPLKKVESAYGPKEVFRAVFETKALREDGAPFCVWSRGFTPSLHEKAAFAQFLRKWFGRVLTAAEEEEFDTESLVGKTAEITVVHEQGRNGETYANIAIIRPERTGKPMVASGKYVRVKDRQQNSDTEYRHAEQASASSDAASMETDWRHTQVHVGRYKGMDLCDLDRASIQALIDNWLPAAKAQAKTTADDRRLIAALEAAAAELEDNILY